MKNKEIVYINFMELKNTANLYFGGDRDKAWAALELKHKGKTLWLNRTKKVAA